MGKNMGEARPDLPTDEQLQPLTDLIVRGGYTVCVKRSDNRVVAFTDWRITFSRSVSRIGRADNSSSQINIIPIL